MPSLFSIALEYVIRNLSVKTTSTIFHKSVQIIGCAGDINIRGTTNRATLEGYGELKERAKEAKLIINVEKNKSNGARQETWKGSDTDCRGTQD